MSDEMNDKWADAKADVLGQGCKKLISSHTLIQKRFRASKPVLKDKLDIAVP